MPNMVSPTGMHDERYVVELDGQIQSRYEIYMEALKAGMKLKQKFPSCKIEVHEEFDALLSS